MNKNKFNYAHFPVGTIVEVTLDHGSEHSERGVPFQVMVTGLVKNGVDSYCIDTSLPDKTSGTFGCNISWITKIVNRGDGPITFKDKNKDSRDKEWWSFYARQINGTTIKKSGSEYLTFEPSGLIYHLAYDYLNPSHVLDLEGLMAELITTGVLRKKIIWKGSVLNPFVANKKKLKKTINRLLNKYKKSIKVARKEEEDDLRKIYEEDFESDTYRLPVDSTISEPSHYDSSDEYVVTNKDYDFLNDH